MRPRPHRLSAAGALLALAVLPALAAAQAKPAVAPVRPAPAAEPKYVLEFEGGVGTTSVDRAKWAEALTPPSDWNMTAYGGSARLFFTRLGRMRLGVEAGYSYFFWYTVTGAGYPITYEPHATRVGAVARSGLGRRMALDVGASAYVFPGGTDVGVNAALGYFIPVGRRWSLPIKVRGDVVFASSTTLVSALALVGLSHPF